MVPMNSAAKEATVLKMIPRLDANGVSDGWAASTFDRVTVVRTISLSVGGPLYVVRTASGEEFNANTNMVHLDD